MLVLTIVFAVLAMAFAIELWSVENRLLNAEIVLLENGLVPIPQHSRRVTPGINDYGYSEQA